MKILPIQGALSSLAILCLCGLGVGQAQEAPKGAAAQEDAAFLKLREEALAAAKCPDRKDPVNLKTTKAKYPSTLRKKKLQGQVVVEAIVLPDGTLSHVQVRRSDHPDFSKEVLRALKDYRYKPATCSGVPVPSSITIAQSFHVY